MKVQMIKLPSKVKSCIVVDEDGTETLYINVDQAPSKEEVKRNIS